MPLSKYKVFKLLREPKLLINRPAQDVLLSQTAKSKVLYSSKDSFDHSTSIKSKPTFTREEKIAKRFTAISTDEVPTCSTDSFESALTRSHSLEDTCTKGDADVDLKSSKTCEKDDMLLNYLNSKASESFNEKIHNDESNKNNNRVVDFLKKIQDLESEKTDTDVLQNTLSNEEVLNENEAMPQDCNCTSPNMLEDNINFFNQEKTEKQLSFDDEIQCDLTLSTNAESIVNKKRTTSPIATKEEVQDSEVWSHDGELNLRDELTEIKEDLSVCVNSCNSVEETNKGEISSSNVISLLDEPEQSKNSQTDTSEDVVMDEASTEDLLSQIESTLSEGDLQIVEEEIVDVESAFEIGDFHFQLDNVEELKLDNFDVNDPMIVDYPVGKKKKKKNTKKSSTKFPLNRNEPPKEEFAVREFHNTIEKLRRWKLRQSFHNLNLSLPKPMTNYSKISVIKEAMKMCIYYTFACKKQELCKQLLLKRNQYLKLKNFYLSRSMRSSYCSVSTAKVDAQIIQLLDEKLADSLPNINHLIKLLALPLYVVVENVKSQKQTQILGELLQKDEMKINVEESADGISPNFSTEIDDSIYISDSETNNIIKKACESLGVIPGLDRMDDVSLLDASTSGINRRKNPQQPVTCSLIDSEKPLQEIDRALNVHENPSDTIVSDLQEFLKAKIDKRDKPRNFELEKVLTETGSDLQKESPRKKSKRKQDLCQKSELDDIWVIGD